MIIIIIFCQSLVQRYELLSKKTPILLLIEESSLQFQCSKVTNLVIIGINILDEMVRKCSRN